MSMMVNSPRFAGAAPPTSVAFFGSATYTGSPVNLPASILAGDVIVFMDSAVNVSGTPPLTVPSGYFIISTTTLPNSRQLAARKVADGTEGGTALGTMGMAGTLGTRKIAAVFRPDNPAVATQVAGSSGQGTSGNPTPQVCTASGGVAPLVVMGCYFGELATVSPMTFSPAADATLGTSQIGLLYKIYNSAPADHTIDMDDEGSGNHLQSFYMQLS